MRNLKVILWGLFLGTTTVTILIMFNYIRFLKAENDMLFVNVNENINQLKMVVATLESNNLAVPNVGIQTVITRDIEKQLKTQKDSGRNRGFLIKDNKIPPKSAP